MCSCSRCSPTGAWDDYFPTGSLNPLNTTINYLEDFARRIGTTPNAKIILPGHDRKLAIQRARPAGEVGTIEISDSTADSSHSFLG